MGYSHIGEYGGNKNQLWLAGHSAGGHTGALLTTDKHYLDEVHVPRSAIRGFAGLAGPYDFVPEDKDIKAVFAPAGGDAKSAMPATYIDGTQPPMLLLWGEGGQPGRQAEHRFYAAQCSAAWRRSARGYLSRYRPYWHRRVFVLPLSGQGERGERHADILPQNRHSALTEFLQQTLLRHMGRQSAYSYVLFMHLDDSSAPTIN